MVKILLVEDEFLIATLLQRKLQLAGFEVCELVSSGEQAVEQVEKEQPDFILMDVRLAGKMNGIEAAREIHKRFQNPIIFMTGYSDEETESKARELNPLAYLIKPIISHQIISIIDTALKKDG